MGAVLARDIGDPVWQALRGFVHRGQAPLPQNTASPVGARLARESDASVWQAQTITEPVGARLPAILAPRFGRHSALAFFAGKPRSNRDTRLKWERCLPAIETPRFGRHSALSFIAGKHRSHKTPYLPLERGLPANLTPRFGRHRPSPNLWERACPRYWRRVLADTPP